jgi:hypothetical protein
MFFSESARIKMRTYILVMGYLAEVLRIIAEGAGMQEALKKALKPASEDIEEMHRNYEILFNKDVADMLLKGALSDKAVFMESPEQAFQQFCSEAYADIKDLLFLHPFNRVFSESLILVSEEEKNVSINICIPEELKEYFDISSHLFPALLASKIMLLKLWKTASSEELYKVDLKNVEKIEVKDVTVEMPGVWWFPHKAEIFKNLAYDDEFVNVAESLSRNLVKATEELKVLKK